MRNVLPAGPGVCSTCKTFIDPQHGQCYPCAMEVAFLDVVVPITYSEHLGQMHHALRGYKDGLPAERAYAMPRIAAILWKFLARHEACVARAIGCEGFEVVTTVPSSSVARDERSPLRTIAEWCNPISDRLDRLLRPTDKVAGRSFSVERFEATRALEGENVLLLDDTWTRGGHADSADYTLQRAGAGSIGLVVVGRHLRPEWEVTPGRTCSDIFKELPKPFDWDTCCVHEG